MYRVLLVDDEPLVLAGIKIMVNWQEQGCVLTGTARNGKQALEQMAEDTPDIVIADINMPLMDGITLLEKAEEAFPDTVFIILTNLQEFDLVRKALHHKAVDYLIKTQMNQQAMEASLQAAKAEVDNRRQLSHIARPSEARGTGARQALQESIGCLLAGPTLPPATGQALEEMGVLGRYTALRIYFVYPQQAQDEGEDFAASANRLFLWQKELTGELAKSVLDRYVLVEAARQKQGLSLFTWGETGLEARVDAFIKKLPSASSNITGISTHLLACNVLEGRASLAECRRQLSELDNAFYLGGQSPLYYRQISPVSYQPLGFAGISARLKAELLEKNINGCSQLFARVIARVESTPHERSQAIWVCNEIYGVICEILEGSPAAKEPGSLFSDTGSGYLQIEALLTRAAMAHFLTTIQNELLTILRPAASRYDDIVEKARYYVREHVTQRIMLKEAAQYVCVSPGYLSAIFKKQEGLNFVDYINQTKVNKACELIGRGEHLIGEIGYLLGYENANYFTRVFKRYMGMTPTEYQEKHRDDT